MNMDLSGRPAGTTARVGLTYARPVPAAWRRDLAILSPPYDKLSYLILHWEPGDEWQPVQRWMLWNCLPPHTTHDNPVYDRAIQECRGPHPRSTGSYSAKVGQWVNGPCRLIDRSTWEIYQQTGRYARRWWVIQGDHGGHRYRLDQTEQTALRWATKGALTDTPAPGDLPYANFDARVIKHLLELDKVRLWKGMTDYTERHADHLNAEEQQAGREARTYLVRWLRDQADLWHDEHGKVIRDSLDSHHGTGTPAADTTDVDQVLDDYINHG